MEFIQIDSIFGGRVLTGAIINIDSIEKPDTFLDACQHIFEEVVTEEIEKFLMIKVNAELSTEFVVKKKDEEIYCDINFITKMDLIQETTNLRDFFSVQVKGTLLKKIADFTILHSGKALSRIYHLQINICCYDPLNRGSTYIPLPKSIRDKKACVNVKNNDPYCFFWAVTSAIHQVKKNADRVQSYPYFGDKFKCKGVRTPVPLQDIPVFEKLNNISINIYTLDKKEKVVLKRKTMKKKSKIHINLLFFSNEDETKSHYVWIKNLNRLVGSQISKSHKKKYVCDNCHKYFHKELEFIQHRSDECPDKYFKISNKKGEGYECEEAVMEGRDECSSENDDYSDEDEEAKIVFPPANRSIMKFRNFWRQIPQPFCIYGDIECILQPVESAQADPGKPYTTKKNMHVPCAIGYVVKYFLDEDFKFCQVIDGPNCVQEFLLKLREIAKLVNDIYDIVYPIDWSQDDMIDFENSSHCKFCNISFSKRGVSKERDHCHMTPFNNYRGALCGDCNKKFYPRRIVSTYLHNSARYDSKILVKAFSNADPKLDIKILPMSNENYISFSIKIDKVEFRFLDSYKFMQASLDTLVKETGKENLLATKKYFGKKFDLMCSKSAFPYEYCTSWARLEENELPIREKFYSSLTGTTVSESDYQRACKIFNVMGCSTLNDYMREYLFLDTLLLHDCMEAFKKLSIATDGLDPGWYHTMAALSWDSMLKTTGVNLELLMSEDQLEFFENALRGGLAQVSGRYSKANNRYMNEYDSSKDEIFILYTDINNEYGWSMRQPLPTGGFEWVPEPDKFDFINENTSDFGYFLEVDLSIKNYNLHDKFKDLPLAPTREKPPGSNTKKLLATLFPKTKYPIHIETLRLYHSLGMNVEKIHRVLKFRHSPWMVPYIDMNTTMRANATSKYAQNYFKTKNNVIWGKACENVKKRRNMMLVRAWEGKCGARKLICRPEFKRMTIFTENLACMELKKKKILYDRPIYLGSTVLDLAKNLLYTYLYVHIKSRFEGAVSMLYTDTDSLILEFTNVNPYEFIKENPDLFDTANFSSDNPYDIKLLNNKKIGLLKDEMGGSIVSEFVGLSAKMYAIRMAGDEARREDETKKAKGLPFRVLRRLTFDDYKKCLIEGAEYEPTLESTSMIRSEKLNLFTVEVNKTTLSSADDKRVLIENFKTLPYGYKTEL